MQKIRYLLVLPILFSVYYIKAQSVERYRYVYTTVLLDSTYSRNENPEMKKYVEHLRKDLSKEMDKIIGESAETLTSYAPASPLSNLLTDMILDFGKAFMKEHHGVSADLSLINFGGIRNIMPKGDITVGTVFQILPFENSLVILSLKGSELKKVFSRFTDKNNQPYSNARMVYRNGKPARITVDGGEIHDERIYRMVTVDFIQTGGDHILENIEWEDVVYTDRLIRDVIIEEIQKMSAQGKRVNAVTDDRVVIEIQP